METAVPPRPEYHEYAPATRWVILAAVMLGTLLQLIDSSIVNVAVPTMMGTLGATLDQISWVSTGYILASVIMLPLTGWLSAVFGRRRYLAGSMALFTIASILCGMAHSLNALVLFRIIQGIGGAALLATAQATIMEIFPPEQLGMVQAIYGMGVIIGPTVGPTLGGWIIDNFSWPWIFYINLPVGIIAVILTLLFMHDSRYATRRSTRIDAVGIGLLAVGLGCLQTLLEKGAKEGWFDSPLIVRLTLCAVVGLVAFVLWELHTPHPVVNLRVLKHRGFTAGTIFGTVLGFGLYGGMFILPVFLQQLRHYTAMQSGLIMLPGAVASGLVMPVIGRIIGRFSARRLTAIGLVATIVATLMLCTITMDTGPDQLLWPLVLRGAAMGFLMVPLTLATLTGLRGHEIAEGTALFNLSRQLGGSAGIAFLSTFVNHRMTYHHAVLAEHITAFSQATQQRLALLQGGFQAKGFSLEVARQQALTLVDRIMQGQAAILAYEDAFRVMALLFALTIPLLLLFDKRRQSAPPVRVPEK